MVAEKHKLEKQRLECLRDVNSTDTMAKGMLKFAGAEAIETKEKTLKEPSLINKLTQAQTWNVTLPAPVFGLGAIPIMDIRIRAAQQ